MYFDPNELAFALALSLQELHPDESGTSKAPQAGPLRPAAPSQPRSNPARRGPTQLSNEERAKLDQERVARQIKRPRESSILPPFPQQKRVKLTRGARQTYPDGAILRTDSDYANSPQTPGITFPELIGPKEDLSLAIFSAFVIQEDWLLSHFETTTPIILVGDAGKSGMPMEKTSETQIREISATRVLVAPPVETHLKNAHPIMHMKYMLLFSKSGGLRVVIASANLLCQDWDAVENYLFVQDLPPATPGADTVKYRPGEIPGEAFPEVLAEVLWATGVEDGLIHLRLRKLTNLPLLTLLRSRTKDGTMRCPLETKWDWSKVTVLLVASLPGRWDGWNQVVRSGQTRLLRAVELIGASLDDWVTPPTDKGKGKSAVVVATKGKGKGKNAAAGGKNKQPSVSVVAVTGDKLQLDIQTASMGKYEHGWIALFRLCAGGRRAGLSQWLNRTNKRLPQLPNLTNIIFPTLRTIRGNVTGELGADEVVCQEEFWKHIQKMMGNAGITMCDSRSRSGPVTTHTKMILGTLPYLAKNAPEDSETESETETESDTEDDESRARPQMRVQVSRPPPCPVPRLCPPPHAWLYLGSHNFSQTAWGSISRQPEGDAPVITVLSYEVGIVMPLESKQDVDRVVSWKHPAPPYAQDDEPWIQTRNPVFKALQDAQDSMKQR
ncbi:hypothetical protein C8F01DRAFT_1369034 [Mycena amicta]|nr:hypothetical protein C8F01DRAFT_1369034 [Mycena amicta]